MAQLNTGTHITAYFDTNPGTAGAIQVPGTGDVKVLNYALALEDLENSLYVQALARLTTGGTSDLGNTFTGLGVTGIDVDYLTEFGQVENDHATFLRAALAGDALPLLAYDFGMQNLNRQQVIELVYSAELTGVSAYLGAIPSFADYTYLQIAAAILGTEARHTAALAYILNNSGLFNESPLVVVAPLYTDNGGKDSSVPPDSVLYAGGGVPADETVGGTGVINPVTGPNGFVYLPTAN
jgi:hypothetical protein